MVLTLHVELEAGRSLGMRLVCPCTVSEIATSLHNCYVSVVIVLFMPIHSYKGHTNSDYKLDSCLSHDDAYVVSGSEDGRVCFWDLVEVG